MWVMEFGERGFGSDRLGELINYFVAGDSSRQREAASIAPPTGQMWGY